MAHAYTANVEERWFPTGSDATATHKVHAEIAYPYAHAGFEEGEVTLVSVVAYDGPEDKDGRELSAEEMAAFRAEHPEVEAFLVEELRNDAVAEAERRTEEMWGR